MDVTVVMIQHLITNTSGYGEKWVTDGGEKIKYHLDVKLMTKGKPKAWMEKDGQVGLEVEWDVIKSANSASIGEATSYLRFGKGLDMLKEYIGLCIDFGIINKAGAWYSFTTSDGTLSKFQGEEKLYADLEADESLQLQLISQLSQFKVV